MITPTEDRLLIIEDMPQDRVGMLYTPEVRSNSGCVLAVGPGRRLENGTVVPMKTKIGDQVLLDPKKRGQSVTLNGNEYLLTRERDILAIR